METSQILCFLLVLLVKDSMAVDDGYAEASVFTSGPGHTQYISHKMDKHADAFGYYNNTLHTTGWGILEIKTNALTSPTKAMYAAGYLEGRLTAGQIWLQYQNVKGFILSGKSAKKTEQLIRNFFNSQEKWMRNMITAHAGSDPYWRQIGYIVAQLDGLYDGYKSAADKSWDQTRFPIQFLNAMGDLIDLRHALVKSSRPDFNKMEPQDIMEFAQRHGHCSALIKILGAYENLYMSHSSWFIYESTMRIYKHYHFQLKDVTVQDISFSSYPGFLESLDDFYLLGSNMVLLQTTNNVFNMSLYDLVGPESLLAWQRVRLANMMANSGSEWYELFKKYNSGTYNNQYMIIDLKKIELHQNIHDNALWVVEQIPGRVTGNDQTPILRTGYWPSYNVPFYEDIYNMSGYPEMVAKVGVDMSYQLAPRAKIFRRDQATVSNMATMKNIMRYNNYKEDPYSEGNACNTICCRGDLTSNPRADGCYDSKVSDYNMAKQFKAFIINGPTLGSGLPPFSWTGSFQKDSHLGLPNVYNFDWQTTQPIL